MFVHIAVDCRHILPCMCVLESFLLHMSHIRGRYLNCQWTSTMHICYCIVTTTSAKSALSDTPSNVICSREIIEYEIRVLDEKDITAQLTNPQQKQLLNI